MAWNLNDYEPVEDRIRAFYSDHRKGRILTEILHHSEDFSFVVFKATVYRNETETAAADGTAYEKASAKGVNATSHIENCETSAIGRALANLGYGAKGKRPSREEMQKVQDSAGSTPSSASQPPKGKTEPKPSGSPSNHSGGEADGPGHTPDKAAESPASPPEKSQEKGSGEVARSSEAPTQLPGGDSQQGPPAAVPPAAESWAVIHAAVGRGTVKEVKVRIAAARLCSAREGVAVPQKYEEIKNCPAEVLAELAAEVRAKETVPA